MTITITDYQLACDTHNLYDVNFYGDQIHTLLTLSEYRVDRWLTETQQLSNHNYSLQPTVVGLDVEWRPNFGRNFDNPIATLQLCIGRRCLIYQLLYTQSIPQSLADFLQDGNFVFVGVGVRSDAEKLLEDYGLNVGNQVDLRGLAAERLGLRELRNAGLKELARQVLGLEIEKPRRVTLSRWDHMWLTPEQVQYACIDAFLSSEIGVRLNAS